MTSVVIEEFVPLLYYKDIDTIVSKITKNCKIRIKLTVSKSPELAVFKTFNLGIPSQMKPQTIFWANFPLLFRVNFEKTDFRKYHGETHFLISYCYSLTADMYTNSFEVKILKKRLVDF